MEIDETMIERLAQRIHQNYLATFAPHGRPWRDLSEDVREANRAQARDIDAKLASVGARMDVVASATPFVFTDVEVDRLAKEEHQRWAQQRMRAGWTYNAVRDDARKQHPMLVSWDELPELERAKDRDAVRNIPVVLAHVGLHVVR